VRANPKKATDAGHALHETLVQGPALGTGTSFVLAAPARAEAGAKPPELPGGDIFGFTTPSDTGETGDTGATLDSTGSAARRDGAYGALETKLGVGRTIGDDWWIAGDAFGAWHTVRNVSVSPFDNSELAFNGLALEVEHRVLQRSDTNPFAVSLLISPRWGRVDPDWGSPNQVKSLQLALYADAVAIADRLFWAGNLIWTPSSQFDAESKSNHVQASTTQITNALTLRITPRFFFGAEAQFLTAFNHMGFWSAQFYQGNAFFLGPTTAYKFDERTALTLAFEPQIFGHSPGAASPTFDLDNFSRGIFRVELAYNF
jgi:hypothetical protein